jgi:hypothetical protein
MSLPLGADCAAATTCDVPTERKKLAEEACQDTPHVQKQHEDVTRKWAHVCSLLFSAAAMIGFAQQPHSTPEDAAAYLKAKVRSLHLSAVASDR